MSGAFSGAKHPLLGAERWCALPGHLALLSEHSNDSAPVIFKQSSPNKSSATEQPSAAINPDQLSQLGLKAERLLTFHHAEHGSVLVDLDSSRVFSLEDSGILRCRFQPGAKVPFVLPEIRNLRVTELPHASNGSDDAKHQFSTIGTTAAVAATVVLLAGAFYGLSLLNRPSTAPQSDAPQSGAPQSDTPQSGEGETSRPEPDASGPDVAPPAITDPVAVSPAETETPLVSPNSGEATVSEPSAPPVLTPQETTPVLTLPEPVLVPQQPPAPAATTEVAPTESPAIKPEVVPAPPTVPESVPPSAPWSTELVTPPTTETSGIEGRDASCPEVPQQTTAPAPLPGPLTEPPTVLCPTPPPPFSPTRQSDVSPGRPHESGPAFSGLGVPLDDDLQALLVPQISSEVRPQSGPNLVMPDGFPSFFFRSHLGFPLHTIPNALPNNLPNIGPNHGPAGIPAGISVPLPPWVDELFPSQPGPISENGAAPENRLFQSWVSKQELSATNLGVQLPDWANSLLGERSENLRGPALAAGPKTAKVRPPKHEASEPTSSHPEQYDAERTLHSPVSSAELVGSK